MFSGGCAQLAGIESTSGDARGGNSVTMTRTSIGADVRSTVLDLTGLQATYLVANPASATGFDRVRAGDAGQGRWTVDLPEPAAVELTVPDGPPRIPRLLSFPTRELKVGFSVLEHPNRVLAPMPAMLNLTVALDAPIVGNEIFRSFTVGSWSSRDLLAAEAPILNSLQVGPVVYDFQTSISQSRRPGLDRLTTQDDYLFLRYVGATLTGVAEPPAFDQTGDDTLTATMAPVSADQVLDVRVDPSQLSTRFAKVRPAVSGLSMTWNVTAAPGASVAEAAGPSLQSGALVATDLGVTVNYGNPFLGRGWRSVFTLSTAQTRVYTPPGSATPITLAAGMTQSIEPSPTFELRLPAGLPELISLDGKPLSTDGQTIPRPTKFLEVTFIADQPVSGQANATLYHLQVFDFVLNAAGTGLDPQLVLVATGSEAKFQIPPETFQAGHNYTLRAVSELGGYPGIASGDLATRSLPVAQSFLDSAVITVTP